MPVKIHGHEETKVMGSWEVGKLGSGKAGKWEGKLKAGKAGKAGKLGWERHLLRLKIRLRAKLPPIDAERTSAKVPRRTKIDR